MMACGLLHSALADTASSDAERTALGVILFAPLALVLVGLRQLPGAAIYAFGAAANGVVLLINHGLMPVWAPMVAAVGANPDGFNPHANVLLDGSIDVSFFAHGGPLIDFIPLPWASGYAFVSIGDLCIFGGLAYLFGSLIVRYRLWEL
jgi:hypothetical protein